MSKLKWLAGLGLAGLGACTLNASPLPNSLPIAQATPRSPTFVTHSLPNATVYTLQIPAASQHRVTIAVADGVRPLAEFAQPAGAIAALNAGFFDPVNRQTTSFAVLDQKLVADPRQNDRLMNNPDLTSYLDQILNRSEFRQYRCNTGIRYDITLHQAAIPTDCQLTAAIGAGPQLLPQNTAIAEGFVDEAAGRDALGSTQPNARSAIGITATGDLLWMLVAQKPNAPGASGMTFAEMAAFLRSQGVEKALNLDGGSSSALYYDGKTRFGKVDRDGNPVQRSVKSALLLLP